VGVFVLLLGSLVVAGCGGRKTAQVSGKVTYGKEVLNSGTVAFLADDGALDNGMIKEDGTYALSKAPVGPVKITVQTFPPSPMVVRPDAAAGSVKGSPPKYTKIPQSYGDPNKSGLTYTVEPGAQTHDIPLQK